MNRPLLVSLGLGFVLLAALGYIFPWQAPRDSKGKHQVESEQKGVFQTTCATCHGESGEGRKDQMTPSIASLPRWYLEEQIRKFRNGQRGAHPKDINGQKMRAAVGELTDKQISEALDHIDTLPALSHASTLGGDAAKGYELFYENCMACHRFNGHGEKVFRSASLNGLQDWYLIEQLGKFQQGIRGYHPDDESGVKMRKSVSYLTSEQQKLDILALLTELAKKYPVVKNSKNQTPKTN